MARKKKAPISNDITIEKPIDKPVTPDNLSIDDLNNAKIELKPLPKTQVEKQFDSGAIKIDLGAPMTDEKIVDDPAAKLKALRATAARTAMNFEKAIYKYTSNQTIDSEEEAMLLSTWKGLCDEFINDANAGKTMIIVTFAMAHGGFWLVHMDEIKANLAKKKAEAEAKKKAQQSPVNNTPVLQETPQKDIKGQEGGSKSPPVPGSGTGGPPKKSPPIGPGGS